MEPVTVGIVGCGNISDAYFAAGDAFDVLRVTACADLDAAKAEAKAAEREGVDARDVAGLLSDPSIDVAVNLTPPAAHGDVCRRALDAGKHVYVEKPLAASTAEAAAIRRAADENGLLVGAAPDTFLGAGLQTCRAAIDEGRIGDPVGATAIWTSPGHERWHPNPDIFYGAGGGPLLDMGPYYVTALVSLLGPASSVVGTTRTTHPERTIRSGPRRGETIEVEVPTHESGVVSFENGATANVSFSFDVQGSALPSPAFEIYGTEATLCLPDPNGFGGPVRLLHEDDEEELPLTDGYPGGRGAGVADLAYALRTDWEQRASVDLATHVLDVAEGVRTSSERGERVEITADCGRPAPLPHGFPDGDVGDR